MTTYPRSMNRYGDFSFYCPHQYKEGFHTSWKPSFVWRGIILLSYTRWKANPPKNAPGYQLGLHAPSGHGNGRRNGTYIPGRYIHYRNGCFHGVWLQSLQGRRRQLYRHPAKCKLSSYYANFLVLNLKNTFWSAVRKGIFESGHPEFTMPCFAKVIMLAANRIQFSIFVKLVVPECWRNSTVRWRA